MGEVDQFNQDVMAAFLALFEFANMPYDEAVRTYLAAFRLPGEAQKIDRMIEKFAQVSHKYIQSNTRDAFTDGETNDRHTNIDIEAAHTCSRTR